MAGQVDTKVRVGKADMLENTEKEKVERGLRSWPYKTLNHPLKVGLKKFSSQRSNEIHLVPHTEINSSSSR